MSIVDVYGCIDYLADNPPAGKMLKLFMEALGSSDEKKSVKQAKKPTFKTEEERLMWEKKQLRNLVSDFGCDLSNLPKKPKRKMADLSKLAKKGGI